MHSISPGDWDTSGTFYKRMSSDFPEESISSLPRTTGSSKPSHIPLSRHSHKLLSQDEETRGLFVWANNSIVVCFLKVSFPA